MLQAAGAVGALAAALTTCPSPTELPAPPSNRPAYSLTMTIALNKKVVTGTSRVSFALERATDRIVFRLWPNMPIQRRVGARLTVRNVRVNVAPVATSTPDPTMLFLSRPVGAGERVTVSMSWTLRMPRTPTERLSALYGVRLSAFAPLLAWDGKDWALDPPAPQLETWTSPVADFDVRVTPPKGMRVFASGARVGPGRWRAVAVRDFALEAGRSTVARRTVHVPSPVVVTAAAESETPVNMGVLLDVAASALATFSQRYGTYPWRTYTVVVEADRWTLADEYPTIVFVSSDVASRGIAVVHETGHQWFYSLVGNNQARDPWLDESLTEWATARFTNSVAAEAAVGTPAEVRNRLGESMTFWGPLQFMPTVWDGLYLQGVKALASFRDDDAVDCALQIYVHDNAYRIASPRDLLAALSRTFSDAEAVLSGFGAEFSR